MTTARKILAALLFTVSVFSAVAQTVTVTAPNGGENWTAGTTHSITWSGTGSSANMAYYKIALSTDGGVTWPTAGTANDLTPSGLNTPSARSFSWTIGSTLNTSQARIRVRALDSGGNILAADTSDANFTMATTETVSIPTGLNGEPNPVQNVASTYSVNASTSSLGHTVEYSFTWGDGTSSSFSTSTSASHAWSSTGQKYVYVTARCQTHPAITANNAPGSYVIVQPPTETVSIPTGLNGEPNPVQNVASTYSVNASTSSLGHTVEYSFTWGDGTSSSFSTSTSASHAWSSTGQKYVYVTARCQTHPVSRHSSIANCGPVVFRGYNRPLQRMAERHAA